MCRTDFFYFGSVAVRFLKTRIRIGISLVRFGSKNAVRFGCYSYLLVVIATVCTATVDDMTLTSLLSLTTMTTSK